jgi:hypothetical protein
MVKHEVINGSIFVTQMKYFIYKNEEDQKRDRPFLTTSEKKMFFNYKRKIKSGELKL